jgi:putative ATP-dependent endonuclease of OLD family
LIAEGRTEYDALIAAARRLSDLGHARCRSLEAIGVAPIDGGGQTNIASLAAHFRTLGKTVFAVCDQQTPEARAAIEATGCQLFESPYKGFELLLVMTTAETALRRFASLLIQEDEWPLHLHHIRPTDATDLRLLQSALLAYLAWAKGAAGGADLLNICSLDEMPPFVTATLQTIADALEPAGDEPEDGNGQ